MYRIVFFNHPKFARAIVMLPSLSVFVCDESVHASARIGHIATSVLCELRALCVFTVYVYINNVAKRSYTYTPHAHVQHKYAQRPVIFCINAIYSRIVYVCVCPLCGQANRQPALRVWTDSLFLPFNDLAAAV